MAPSYFCSEVNLQVRSRQTALPLSYALDPIETLSGKISNCSFEQTEGVDSLKQNVQCKYIIMYMQLHLVRLTPVSIAHESESRCTQDYLYALMCLIEIDRQICLVTIVKGILVYFVRLSNRLPVRSQNNKLSQSLKSSILYFAQLLQTY